MKKNHLLFVIISILLVLFSANIKAQEGWYFAKAGYVTGYLGSKPIINYYIILTVVHTKTISQSKFLEDFGDIIGDQINSNPSDNKDYSPGIDFYGPFPTKRVAKKKLYLVQKQNYCDPLYLNNESLKKLDRIGVDNSFSGEFVHF